MLLIEKASARKLRGAYYTPPAIASFLLRWGLSDSKDADILEPSCGDGVFLRQIASERMPFHHLTAVELEKCEAGKARAIGLRNSEVVNTDFHRFCLETKRRFDLVVGNPPFIRYQYYAPEQQTLASDIFTLSGLKRSKLTNAWVTFVVGCSFLLRDKGKMGFVVPSELLQVSYASQLRRHLARCFNKINIISFENLVFRDIQQEVVLLLCEKTGTAQHNIEHIEVRDAEALRALDPHKLGLPQKQIDFHADKWNYYFLDKKEIDFIRRVRDDGMPRIGDYANVEVGITTGSNGYFTVPKSVVDLYQLHDYARPMVGRSVQVNSICFTIDDWRRNRDLDLKANLLVFTPKAAMEGGEGVRSYIQSGEQQGVNKGYKTGIRDDWYVIPSIKLSDALFLRRNNVYPKFVLNEACAYTTDTMHRVFINEGINREALIASYYNSLSFAFAEIAGRNFGGGVLELMPSEVESVYLPYRKENGALFAQVDRMVREKKNVDEILDFADDLILRQGMGFSSKETRMARSIWHKLMARRLGRKRCLREPNEHADSVNVATRAHDTDVMPTVLHLAHRGKPEQLRLAIEKRKRYKGAVKKVVVKSKTKRNAKTGRLKSVKARYVKHNADKGRQK